MEEFKSKSWKERYGEFIGAESILNKMKYEEVSQIQQIMFEMCKFFEGKIEDLNKRILKLKKNKK